MSDFSFSIIPSNECVGNSLSTINLNFNAATQDLTTLNTKITALSAYATDTHNLSTVRRIVAGSNIVISPPNGTGVVTISSIAVNGETPTGQEILSAINVGAGGVGFFKQKSGQSLQFKKLVSGGSNVQLFDQGDTIRVVAYDRSGSPGGETNTASNEGDGVGLAMPKNGFNLPFRTLRASPSSGVELISAANTVSFASTISAQNLGSGAKIFKQRNGNLLTFKTLVTGSKGIRIEEAPNDEIKLSLTPFITAANLGTGFRIFKDTDPEQNRLNFRTLVSGTNERLEDSPCDVRYRNSDNSIELTVYDNVSATHVGTGPGRIFKDKQQNNLRFRTIRGLNNIEVTTSQQNPDEVVISLRTGVLSSTVIGVNAGTEGTNVFKEKNGPELIFRKLVAGNNITLVEQPDSIQINSTASGTGGGDITGALNIGGQIGIFDQKVGSNLHFKTLSSANTSNLRIIDNSTTKTITLSVGSFINSAQNTTSTGRVFKEKIDNSLVFRTIKGGPGITVEEGGVNNQEIIITSISNTPSIQASGIATNFKNKIINGNFDIWQRNTPSNSITVTDTLTSSFLADRFGFFSGRRLTGGTGNQTSTLSCVNLTLTDTLAISSRPSYCSRIILGTQATGSLIPTTFLQRIENIISLAGKTVTLSLWARSNNTGNATLPVFCQQAYRVAPTSTFTTDTNVGTFNLTSSWKQYTVTFQIPIINETLWSNAWPGPAADAKWNSYTQISFQIPGTAGRFVDITGIQLEEQNTNTPFEERPEQVELSLCERYFQKEDNKFHVFPAGPHSEASHTFKIPLMRTNPRVTHTIIQQARLGVAGSPPFSGSKDQLFFQYDHDAQTNTAGFVKYSWTADAEF